MVVNSHDEQFALSLFGNTAPSDELDYAMLCLVLVVPQPHVVEFELPPARHAVTHAIRGVIPRLN
jgi:hypothetical protein